MVVRTIRRWFGSGRQFRPESDGVAAANPLQSLPEGLRLYVIGDIHGRADLLAAMHDLIDRIETNRPVSRSIEIVLGDMIDRGPDSAGVTAMLIARARRRELKALRGNHEDMLLRFLAEPANLRHWARLGGLDTLLSYGVRPEGPIDDAVSLRTARLARAAIPADHIAFLQSLLLYWRLGDFTFVHAGLRPGYSLEEQVERDLLEIREPFLSHKGSFGTFVVHGHTPVMKADIRPNRINVDTGAFATGWLSAVLIERDRLEVLEPLAAAKHENGGER